MTEPCMPTLTVTIIAGAAINAGIWAWVWYHLTANKPKNEEEEE